MWMHGDQKKWTMGYVFIIHARPFAGFEADLKEFVILICLQQASAFYKTEMTTWRVYHDGRHRKNGSATTGYHQEVGPSLSEKRVCDCQRASMTECEGQPQGSQQTRWQRQSIRGQNVF